MSSGRGRGRGNRKSGENVEKIGAPGMVLHAAGDSPAVANQQRQQQPTVPNVNNNNGLTSDDFPPLTVTAATSSTPPVSGNATASGGDSRRPSPGVSNRPSQPSGASSMSLMKEQTNAMVADDGSESGIEMDIGREEMLTRASMLSDEGRQQSDVPGAVPDMVMPAGPRKGTRGTATIVQTNIFKLKLPPKTPMFRYECDITADIGKGAPIDFTKKPKNDYRSMEKRDICYAIFYALVHHPRSKGVFGQFFEMVYDRCRILYSLHKIDMKREMTLVFFLEPTPEEFSFTPDQFKNLHIAKEIRKFHIEIWPATDQFELILDDYKPALEPDLLLKNRDLIQFIEMATSQNIYYNLNHVMFNNIGFPRDTRAYKNIGQGREMATGFKKSAALVEGEANDRGKKEAVPALVIDSKTAAFFKPQLVVDYLQEYLKWDKRDIQICDNRQLLQDLNFQLKNLAVSTIYEPHHTFEINRITPEPTSGVSFDVNGKRTSIVDYYKLKYKISLKYTRLPCLIDRKGSQFSYYPMELCQICPHQRVPLEKQTPDQMKAMIKEAAEVPSRRMQTILNKANDAGLFANDFQDNLGISISCEPMRAPARVLPHPTVEYKGERPKNPDGYGGWRSNAAFYKPAECKNMAVVFFRDNRQMISKEEVKEFVFKWFLPTCKRQGMHMPSQPRFDCLNRDETGSGINSHLKLLSAQGVDFILFFSPDRNAATHAQMKYSEVQWGIVTQDVLVYNVLRIVHDHKNDIVEKIVMKTNIKLGGLNYRLHLEKPELEQKWLDRGILYFGIDVNHPPPMSAGDRARGEKPTEPSVIGMSANALKDPLEFVGAFAFQDPRTEQLERRRITELVTTFLQMFRVNRGILPQSVIVFRDDFNERRVKETEIPAFRDAISREYQDVPLPKLVVFTVKKNCSQRIFQLNLDRVKNMKAFEQNVKPGTVVDSVITTPRRFEFYLISHKALQGTARSIKFTVIENDFPPGEFTHDYAQGIAHLLAFDHQIVTSPISIPAPCLHAHELAKRGKSNYRAYKKMEGSVHSLESMETNFEDFWEAVTEKLTVLHTKLQGRKFNA